MPPVKKIIARQSLWERPDVLERAVVRCVLADHAGAPLPAAVAPIAPYWRAFKSRFTPATPFTLYSPFVDRVALYVYEPDFNTTGIPRDLFFARCAKINERLGAIARIVIDLAGKHLVTLDFRGALHPPLPPDLSTTWRRFDHITRDRREIIHIMSCGLIPTPDLHALI